MLGKYFERVGDETPKTKSMKPEQEIRQKVERRNYEKPSKWRLKHKYDTLS